MHSISIPPQSLFGSVLVELDSNKKKLRQKEGWYHWVVAPQEAEGSEPSTYPAGDMDMVGAQDYSILAGAGDSLLLSTAPSEASDSVVVS